MKKQIEAAFKRTKFKLNFGDDYLNISRSDGMHCEFYGDDLFTYLTATYTIDGKVKECDYYISDEDSLAEFVSDVKKILK